MGHTTIVNYYHSKWLVPSRPHANPWVAKPPERLWPRKRLASRPRPAEVSRSPIVTARVPSRFVRSVVTSVPPSFSSASSRSSASFVRLRRTSRPTSASSRLPWPPFRRPQRRTSLASLRTPTSAPSTPSVSPSWSRTSSSPSVSEAIAKRKIEAEQKAGRTKKKGNLLRNAFANHLLGCRTDQRFCTYLHWTKYQHLYFIYSFRL